MGSNAAQIDYYRSTFIFEYLEDIKLKINKLFYFLIIATIFLTLSACQNKEWNHAYLVSKIEASILEDPDYIKEKYKWDAKSLLRVDVRYKNIGQQMAEKTEIKINTPGLWTGNSMFELDNSYLKPNKEGFSRFYLAYAESIGEISEFLDDLSVTFTWSDESESHEIIVPIKQISQRID